MGRHFEQKRFPRAQESSCLCFSSVRCLTFGKNQLAAQRSGQSACGNQKTKGKEELMKNEEKMKRR
jgi:hypothetical protein